MNTTKKLIACAFVALTFVGCAGMSHQERDTVVGAGVGAAAGAAITGDVGGALIGGAAGGVIGHEVGRH
jgi:osmotically inducible lipoprotein OsmB